MRGLVVGVGNIFRGDDAVGCMVAQALRPILSPEISIIEHEGDPADLIALWDGMPWCIVIDALNSTDPAGTVITVNLLAENLPPWVGMVSSHACGVAEAVALARVMGRLPIDLMLFGVVGKAFAVGAPPSSAVVEAVPRVTEMVRLLVDAYVPRDAAVSWRAND